MSKLEELELLASATHEDTTLKLLQNKSTQECVIIVHCKSDESHALIRFQSLEEAQNHFIVALKSLYSSFSVLIKKP